MLYFMLSTLTKVKNVSSGFRRKLINSRDIVNENCFHWDSDHASIVYRLWLSV